MEQPVCGEFTFLTGKGMLAMVSSNASSASVVEESTVPGTDLGAVDNILEQHHFDSTELIAILLDVQDKLGYLPVPALSRIAQQLNVNPTEIYGIATFYSQFRLYPPGRHQFTVCMGTACHVRGAVQVLREFERRLCICAGETTSDLEYGLETVNCVGACAIGPLVIVDDEYHGDMTTMRVPILLRRLERARVEEQK